jgi:PleD family two-component response regulator
MVSNAATSVRKESDLTSPHILVVEDQPNTADMLTSYFQALGYEVSAVGWGEDALEFVEHTLPDLVVLDIRLPDIDGYEVCRYLRSHRRTKYVPIIFLTEKKGRTDKLQGLELGAVDYITKPFDVQELRLRVRNVLRRSGAKQKNHPITGLPTVPLSDERLHELLDKTDWSILSVGLCGLQRFSETYGFVARDDVMRSIALILTHISEEYQSSESFVGHFDATTDLFIIIAPDYAEQARHALENRLNEAISFFYPYADRQDHNGDNLPLCVEMGILTSSKQSYNSLRDLKKALVDVRKAQITLDNQ